MEKGVQKKTIARIFVFRRSPSLPPSLTHSLTLSLSLSPNSLTDSPVIAELSIDTPAPSPRMTQSAGTAEPEETFTKSPGTSSEESSVCQTPPRFAVARGLSDAFKADTASAAFVVSWKPIPALTNWIKSKIPTSV